MFKIAICEDEEEILKDTGRKCIEYLGKGNVKVSLFSKGSSLLNAKEQFDLVLLDIELSDMSGINVMNEFELRRPYTYIAFLTAYDSYAKEAYGRNVLGFLSKPLKKSDLQRIIEKIKKLQSGALIELDDNGKTRVIPVDKIIYISSDDKYTKIVTEEGNFLERKTLSYWENILPQLNFGRVSRFCIINFKYYKKDGLYIKISDSDKVKISRVYKDELEENYKRYLWTLARMM